MKRKISYMTQHRFITTISILIAFFNANKKDSHEKLSNNTNNMQSYMLGYIDVMIDKLKTTEVIYYDGDYKAANIK